MSIMLPHSKPQWLGGPHIFSTSPLVLFLVHSVWLQAKTLVTLCDLVLINTLIVLRTCAYWLTFQSA